MNDAAAIEEVEDVDIEEAEADTTETGETTDEAQATDEQEPAESSTEKKEDDEKADKVQQRIDEITKIRREEERQRIRAEQRAQELEQQLEQLKPRQPPGKTLADFDYDEGQFGEYLTDQAAQQAREQVQHQIEAEKAREREVEFSVKESDFATEHDDYRTVTRSQDLKLTQSMVQVAQGSEHGPALLYHLGKNPEVSERLAYMSPMDMAREMGRLESVVTQPKPKSTTNAPKPTPKITATEKAKTIKSDSPESDSLSTEEWVARERKRLANRNK